MWEKRIIGHEDVAPADLLANPRNWRIHTQLQQQAVKTALDHVGWLRDVLVNMRTGYVIDGHLRVTLAMRENEPTVPVDYVDLSEEEEAFALASLDATVGLAEVDESLLARLHEEVDVTPFWRQEQIEGILARAAKAASDLTLTVGNGNSQDPPPQQPGNEAGDGDGEQPPVPTSHVRMVQLFLNTETFPLFMRYVETLEDQYGTANTTETVMECLARACTEGAETAD